MTSPAHTTIRLTEDERARLLAVAEAQGATGIAGGIRAALVLAEGVMVELLARAGGDPVGAAYLARLKAKGKLDEFEAFSSGKKAKKKGAVSE